MNSDSHPGAGGSQGSIRSGEPAKIRVIMVDDSDVFLDAAMSVLTSEPRLEVIGQAGSATEALAKVQELKPDLVIADLRMPGTSGLDLTRSLKALPSPPKVIVVSFYSGSEERDGSWYAGADGFVPKVQFVGRLPALIDELFPLR